MSNAERLPYVNKPGGEQFAGYWQKKAEAAERRKMRRQAGRFRKRLALQRGMVVETSAQQPEIDSVSSANFSGPIDIFANRDQHKISLSGIVFSAHPDPKRQPKEYLPKSPAHMDLRQKEGELVELKKLRASQQITKEEYRQRQSELAQEVRALQDEIKALKR